MFLVVFIINLLSISWMQIEQNLQGKKSGKVQKVESIGERKNTEPIEIFSFYWRILCRRLALMHQGRVCVDISPICVRVWSCVIRMLQTDPRGDYCVPVFSLPASKLISLSFDEGGLFKKERMMCNSVYYWECLILIFAFPPSTCRLTGEAILHGVLIDDITLWVKENALLHINALILEDVYFMKNNSFDIYLVLGR